MTDDEREFLIGYMDAAACDPAQSERATTFGSVASQLRADGERIQALEAALAECSDRLRKEEARVGRIEAALADLSARQQPLGAEFEDAINADREGLYDNDPPVSGKERNDGKDGYPNAL